MLLALWTALGLHVAWAAEPGDATVVYYNARIALREEAPTEASRYWMLRNALEDATGHVSPHDPDFHSVPWAALAELGICPDGLPTDEDGAGLWTLALHNHIVRTRGRRQRTPRVKAFDAFKVGRHQRHVAIRDVLSLEELEALRLSRGWCVRPWRAQVLANEGLKPKLRDRQVAARTMRDLLERSHTTLNRDTVQGYAVVEARLFDLDLQLTALAAREARQKARDKARTARVLGLGRPSIEAMVASEPTTTLDPTSEAARVVQECVDWPVSEWLALSPDRRAFLFDHARKHADDLSIDPTALDRLALSLVDAAIAGQEGALVVAWVARIEDPERRQAVWDGERGLQLLGLDATTGFTERGVIALHRGVAFLERGDLDEALRSLAFAVQQSVDSTASDDVARLGRRWLSYVAGRFSLSESLVLTLQSLLPRRDYSVLLEDLLWRSAFHADSASFAMGVEHAGGRAALDRRMVFLMPLASGDVGTFSRGLARGMAESPSETLRFIEKLLERLELEKQSIRRAQLPTVAALRYFLRPLADEVDGRYARKASDLLDRCRAIEDGLLDPSHRTDPADRAESLDPNAEVFAGNVRLAPIDPLPWPFVPTTPPPPSVFVPLELTPAEWRDDRGALVLGWRVTE
jgi:hypothetical protein